MPLLSFTLLTTAGSLIWNTIFVMAGYLLGENWELVETYVGVGTNVVIAIVVLAVVVFVGVRLAERRKEAWESPLRERAWWARPWALRCWAPSPRWPSWCSWC
ncbi:DedA family protein [Nonomuraea antimicrobica]